MTVPRCDDPGLLMLPQSQVRLRQPDRIDVFDAILMIPPDAAPLFAGFFEWREPVPELEEKWETCIF